MLHENLFLLGVRTSLMKSINVCLCVCGVDQVKDLAAIFQLTLPDIQPVLTLTDKHYVAYCIVS